MEAWGANGLSSTLHYGGSVAKSWEGCAKSGSERLRPAPPAALAGQADRVPAWSRVYVVYGAMWCMIRVKRSAAPPAALAGHRPPRALHLTWCETLPV
jgi:hypothetical protein